MAGIKFEHVRKTYDSGNTVIDDLNLEIKDKEFVVLVGPSGCGKSTTLRMIAGLEDITAGDLYIGDQRVNDVEPKNRDIAMVFQSYALYPHKTVYKNMSFALELKKTPKDEIDRRVREAAKILEIEEYLDRKPKALSGGQRQRVALGRAIVRNPKVFLLDEPLSNLDAKLRAGMRTQIAALHKRLETTFVYVTHDQTEAMTMGDRICVMKDGYIQQYDTPQTLYDMPANMFVAGFIGTPQMNFIPVTVLKEDNQFYLSFANHKIKVDNPKLEDYVNKEVIMGIRPEFVLVNEGEGIPAHVEISELLGSDKNLIMSCDNQEITATISSRKQINSDGNVTISFDTTQIHVFDKETEFAIR